MYSSSRDKTIKAWQAHKEKNDPLMTFEGHRLVVTAIDLNDGETSILVIYLNMCFKHIFNFIMEDT